MGKIKKLPNNCKISPPLILFLFIASSLGGVQLGGPDPWCNWGGPAKVGACNCHSKVKKRFL